MEAWAVAHAQGAVFFRQGSRQSHLFSFFLEQGSGYSTRRKRVIMKQNKRLLLHIVVLSICILLGWESCIALYFRLGFPIPIDLTFRYNEVSCAHQGIDPFDIFEHNISSEEFCGLDRPDFPYEEKNGKKIVHSYPAWHMAVFWWYGYVPKEVCIAIMIGLYLCSLLWSCYWTSKKLQKSDCLHYVVDILSLLAAMTIPFGCLCTTMNYGLFLLGCSLLLYNLLETQHTILAGMVFSLIMLKPQVGIPFLIPLFLNKKYQIIAIAGAICIAETLFTSWQLNKSPIELILQIPQLGAPFQKGFFTNTATKVFGPVGQYLTIGGFLAIISVLSFLVRNAENIWVRFLPAIALVPFWTYSQEHDWLVTLPCYIYILNNKDKYPRLYNLLPWLIALCVLAIFFWFNGIYILGKHRASTPLLLTLLSISCCMAVLDEKERWEIRFSPKDLFSQMSFWKTKKRK